MITGLLILAQTQVCVVRNKADRRFGCKDLREERDRRCAHLIKQLNFCQAPGVTATCCPASCCFLCPLLSFPLPIPRLWGSSRAGLKLYSCLHSTNILKSLLRASKGIKIRWHEILLLGAHWEEESERNRRQDVMRPWLGRWSLKVPKMLRKGEVSSGWWQTGLEEALRWGTWDWNWQPCDWWGFTRETVRAHRELDALEIVKRDPWATAETKGRKLEPSKDFPGGLVVKNLPSNAGDAGSISCRGTEIPHDSNEDSMQPNKINGQKKNTKPHSLAFKKKLQS